jgi:hypothetical protein
VRPTKPFEIVTGERFLCLPTAATVLGVVDLARAAALEFCTSARFGWGRGELLGWLNGSYRDVLLATGNDASFVEGADVEIDEVAVTRLVARARSHAADMVEGSASSWSARGFAREMIESGLVVGITDGTGGLGYAPRNCPGSRLVDRVTSLFLADYLTRPRDYESLSICSSCNEISFAWEEAHSHDCETRGPNSGIIVRPRPNFTRIGLGARRAS